MIRDTGASSPPPAYKNHPAADLFPMMDANQFAALKSDIDANGLREPIFIHDGMVLDGRNRLLACIELGITPVYEPATQASSIDPINYVLSKNLNRRHLSTGQRAAVAVAVEAMRAKVAKVRQREHGGTAPGRAKNTSGKKTISDEPAPTARDEAATALQVSPSSVGKAKRIAKESPAAFDAMKDGTITLSQAERKLPAKRIKKKSEKPEPTLATDDETDAKAASKLCHGENGTPPVDGPLPYDQIRGMVQQTVANVKRLAEHMDAVSKVNRCKRKAISAAKALRDLLEVLNHVNVLSQTADEIMAKRQPAEEVAS